MSNNVINFKQIAGSLDKKFLTYGSVKADFHSLLDDAENVLLMGTGKCAIITGDTGTGKTMMATKLVERLNECYARELIELQDQETSTKKAPCARYIKSPSNMKPLDLLRRILIALGEPGIPSGNENEMQHRVEAQIRNGNVKALLFDEFQQVIEKVGNKSVRQIADFLKNLMDEHGLFMIFCGTERTKEIKEHNDQFESRCTRVIEKPHFSLANKTSYKMFTSFLYTMQIKHEISGIRLADAENALAIYATTNGDLRKISWLILMACKHAYLTNSSAIRKIDFSQTYVPLTNAKPKSIKHKKGNATVVKTDKRVKLSNPFNLSLKSLKEALGVTYDV
jgi:archaellum biogenesis ATPase FlaH